MRLSAGSWLPGVRRRCPFGHSGIGGCPLLDQPLHCRQVAAAHSVVEERGCPRRALLTGGPLTLCLQAGGSCSTLSSRSLGLKDLGECSGAVSVIVVAAGAGENPVDRCFVLTRRQGQQLAQRGDASQSPDRVLIDGERLDERRSFGLRHCVDGAPPFATERGREPEHLGMIASAWKRCHRSEVLRQACRQQLSNECGYRHVADLGPIQTPNTFITSSPR
jgi:hypothetical protein